LSSLIGPGSVTAFTTLLPQLRCSDAGQAGEQRRVCFGPCPFSNWQTAHPFSYCTTTISNYLWYSYPKLMLICVSWVLV